MSVRTVIAVLGLGAYGLTHLAGLHAVGGMNTWDVFMPAMTDSTALVVIGLTWWLTWLIPTALAASPQQRLIRFGSFAAATRADLLFLAGSVAALILLAAVIFLGLSAALGLSTDWSAAARSFHDGTPSAFSSAGLAARFPTPILAVICTTGFAAAGYMVIAAPVLAAAVRGHTRAAMTVAVVTVTWALICSSSPLPIPPPIDASLLVSLGWALVTPNGLAISLTWWVVALVVALLLVRPAGVRVSLRQISGRGASLAALLIVAAAGVLNAMNRTSSQGTGVAAAFYAGPFGDLVSYVVVAVIPIGFATAFLSRLSEATSGALVYQALRRGSYRRWLTAGVLREVGWAAVLAMSVGLLVTVGDLVQAHGTPPSDMAYLLTGAVGLFAATVLQTVIAAGLLWVTSTPATVWPIIAGAMLAFGYWFPLPLQSVNVLAPYGAPADSIQPAVPLAAAACTLVVASILTTAALIRAVPRNAEQLA